jgi:hypothetical protein
VCGVKLCAAQTPNKKLIHSFKDHCSSEKLGPGLWLQPMLILLSSPVSCFSVTQSSCYSLTPTQDSEPSHCAGHKPLNSDQLTDSVSQNLQNPMPGAVHLPSPANLCFETESHSVTVLEWYNCWIISVHIGHLVALHGLMTSDLPTLGQYFHAESQQATVIWIWTPHHLARLTKQDPVWNLVLPVCGSLNYSSKSHIWNTQIGQLHSRLLWRVLCGSFWPFPSPEAGGQRVKVNSSITVHTGQIVTISEETPNLQPYHRNGKMIHIHTQTNSVFGHSPP